MNKKVLMFAYDYPPKGWSGVQRTVKFVRYMSGFGWDPIVITPSGSYFPKLLDHSFNDEVAHALTIRTKIFTPKDFIQLSHKLWRCFKPFLLLFRKDEKWLLNGLKWRFESFFFPDEGVTWLPYCVKAGLDAVRKYNPKIIYATAPPYSTLISGWIVAQMSGLPLVVDLRDLWVDNPSRIIEGCIKKKIDRFLEYVSLSSSDAVITTTKTGADLLRTKYPKKGEKIYTIYNGYDKNDFDRYIRNGQYGVRQKKLTMSHVGSLYAERSPEPFLKGMSVFLQQKNLDHIPLTVRFVGMVSSFSKTFKAYADLGVISIEEPVEHPEAIKLMICSDLLILIMPKGSQRVVYAKVFEYMASGTPILGILPMDGEVADLLRQIGNSWIVDIEDEKGIVQRLNEIYERWCKGQKLSKNGIRKEIVDKFERNYLTSQLCEIFEAAVIGKK